MRRNRGLLLGAAWLLLCLCGCGADADAAGHSVALIAKSTETEFWLSAFAGARAAATEYNLELTISGPDTEEDYETQNQMIAQAVEDGVEAIVFSAISYGENAAAIDAAAGAGVRIVSIDSSVGSGHVSTYIGTDNYAAGQMAALAALEGTEGVLHVGLVSYSEGTANGQERVRGAVDALAESGRAQVTEVITTLADVPRAQTDTVRLLQDRPEINVLIALNEPTSVGAALAVQVLDRGEDVFLVGFDSNVVTIDGLQEGWVDALVVQNPYAMGYLGVERAYRLLIGKGGTEQVIDTSTRIVTRENLFTSDVQKALFAFDGWASSPDGRSFS